MDDDQFSKEETITLKVGQNTKEIFRYIIIILLGILFLQNSRDVVFSFFFWDIPVPLLILLPLFFLLGYFFKHFKFFSSIIKNEAKKDIN